MKYIKLFETFTEAPYEWDKEEYDQFKSEYDEIANIKLEIEICKNNIERAKAALLDNKQYVKLPTKAGGDISFNDDSKNIDVDTFIENTKTELTEWNKLLKDFLSGQTMQWWEDTNAKWEATAKLNGKTKGIKYNATRQKNKLKAEVDALTKKEIDTPKVKKIKRDLLKQGYSGLTTNKIDQDKEEKTNPMTFDRWTRENDWKYDEVRKKWIKKDAPFNFPRYDNESMKKLYNQTMINASKKPLK